MKRVLIVAADGLSKSGVPNVFMGIIKNLSPKGYVFDVVYFDDTHTYYLDEINASGGKAIFLKTSHNKKGKLKKLHDKMMLCKRISKIIKENGPYDVVHSFKGFDSGYILKAAKKHKIEQRFSHLCFTYVKSKNPLVRLIEKIEIAKTKKYSKNAIFDSEKTMNINLPGYERNRIIRNYFNDDELTFIPLKKEEDLIKFVQIGSYSFNKNQMFSLEVFKKVLHKKPGSQLHYIGFPNPDDLGYFDKLSQLVKEKGLEGNVIFHNFDAKQKDIFEECNYCLFPSIYESFGIVPVEAQAVGLKCFCSDTVTRENNCGGCTYLPLNDSDAWVNAILDDFKKTSGKHNKFDVSRFAKETITNEYLDLYTK